MSVNLSYFGTNGKPIINHNEDEGSMPQVIHCVNNITKRQKSNCSICCGINMILIEIGSILFLGRSNFLSKPEQLIYKANGNEGITPMEGDVIIIGSASDKRKPSSFDGSSG